MAATATATIRVMATPNSKYQVEEEEGSARLRDGWGSSRPGLEEGKGEEEEEEEERLGSHGTWSSAVVALPRGPPPLLSV